MKLNNKGQSLVGVLVASAIMGIVTLSFMQLMSHAIKQQANVQRRSNWTALQGNITSNLRNKNGCDATVTQLVRLGATPQPLSIMLANKALLISNGDNLSFQLTNVAIKANVVGNLNAQTTTQTVNQVTQKPCGKEEFDSVTVVTTTYTGQIKLAVSGSGPIASQLYSQDYYINVSFDSNQNVTGCLL